MLFNFIANQSTPPEAIREEIKNKLILTTMKATVRAVQPEDLMMVPDCGYITFWYNDYYHQCEESPITEEIFNIIISGEFKQLNELPENVYNQLKSEAEAFNKMNIPFEENYIGASLIKIERENGEIEDEYYLLY